jgi:hypothetical protein
MEMAGLDELPALESKIVKPRKAPAMSTKRCSWSTHNPQRVSRVDALMLSATRLCRVAAASYPRRARYAQYTHDSAHARFGAPTRGAMDETRSKNEHACVA